MGGGSTITQQYVKNATGQDQATLWRKYKEVVISVKISKEQSKDQILENYLNTIYFGRGAYGIQAASKAYFNKDVGKLTVAEGAMLAGTIQSPSNTDVDRSKARFAYVLDQMAQAGWVTPAERARQVYPQPLPQAPASIGVPGDDRYHIYDRAMKELAASGIAADQISTGGLTITTTVDGLRQKQLVDVINATMSKQPANLRAAAVSIDPRTGAVVAYYGGSNGVGQDYAGDSERQPGSAFKPFVLSAALQSGKGIGLGSVYDGSSGQLLAGRKVNNSDGVSCNQCSVQTAMTQSINTVFYKMGIDVGPSRVIDAAHQAGIPKGMLGGQADGGIALGDQEVHPIDMASAYATFAADGVLRTPHIVLKVVAADGRVLLDRTDTVPTGDRAMPQQVARNVTESMIDVASTSSIALSGGRAVAAKTGTVQLGSTRDNKDTWTVGYTPSLSTAVWVGTDQSEPVRTKAGRAAYGRTIAGPIWQDFMNAALKGTPPEDFSPFEPMGVPVEVTPTATVDPVAPTVDPTATSDSNGNGNGNGNDKKNKKKDSNNNSTSNNNNSDSGAAFVLPGVTPFAVPTAGRGRSGG